MELLADGFALAFLIIALAAVVCILLVWYRERQLSLRLALLTLILLASTVRGLYFVFESVMNEPYRSLFASLYYPLCLSIFSMTTCHWSQQHQPVKTEEQAPKMLSASSLIVFLLINGAIYAFELAVWITSLVIDGAKQLLTMLLVHTCFLVVFWVAITLYFWVQGIQTYFTRFSQPKQHVGLAFQGCFQLSVLVLFCLSIYDSVRGHSALDIQTLLSTIVELSILIWWGCALMERKSPDSLWILNPRALERQPDSVPLLSDSAVVDLPLDAKCWICLDDNDNGGEYISPCLCKGSMGFVHEACLKKWISVKLDPNPSCPTCCFRYVVLSHPFQAFANMVKRSFLLFSSAVGLFVGSFLTAYVLAEWVCESVLLKGLSAVLLLVGEFLILLAFSPIIHRRLGEEQSKLMSIRSVNETGTIIPHPKPVDEGEEA